MNPQCPICRSFQIQSHYQLHVGGSKNLVWTTRQFRQANNLKPDNMQILVVPPIDTTWNTCKMCGTEFGADDKIYENIL